MISPMEASGLQMRLWQIPEFCKRCSSENRTKWSGFETM
jgi:hypothetical protein